MDVKPVEQGTRPLMDGSLTSLLNEDVVVFDLGNKRFMSQVDSDLGFRRYWVADGYPVLDNWHTDVTMDGSKGDGQGIKQVFAKGRIFKVVGDSRGVILETTFFCEAERNVMFSLCHLKNMSNAEHTVELSFEAKFNLGTKLPEYMIKHGMGTERAKSIETVYEAKEDVLTAVTDAGLSAMLGASIPSTGHTCSNVGGSIKYRLTLPPKEERGFCLILAGGWSKQEINKTYRDARKHWDKYYEEAQRYWEWISTSFTSQDAVLNSMYSSCLNCSLSNYKEVPGGGFKALIGGNAWPRPTRTYFRDAYWTIQSLLP